MVYVPLPGVTENPDPPIVDVTPELIVQRDLTHWFILVDPTPVVLIPHEKMQTFGGGYRWEDLPPRPEQIFKLIPMSHTERPVRSTTTGGYLSDAGEQRKYDYTVMGEWDAVIRVGDWWENPITEQRYVIDSILPYNGYEVKAMAMSYGGDPDHG